MDTTATTVRWGILFLAAFPETQRKVHEELDQAKESIQLEATEIQPTPVEEQPAEISTPVDTETISKTKKIKKRVIKPTTTSNAPASPGPCVTAMASTSS